MSNVELVRSVYDAFGRGDVDTVLSAMDPAIEWRQAEGNPYEPSGAAWIGPDAVMQNLFVRIVTEWDGFTVTPKEFHDAGDTVVVEGRYTGTYKATGRSMDAQFCHVFKIRDGKATSFQQFVDTAQVQNVTGLP
jgi:ketosteroid isomerase-like protein